MPKFHFEDFPEGHTAVYGSHTVTRDEIVGFAAEFDPQPMHLDEEAGRTSMLGGLAASGWHGCCILMRLIADGFILDSASMGAGAVDEVKWLQPLRPGETVTLRATVLNTRTSRSRPEMGIVRFLFELIDTKGNRILTLTAPLMLGRRETAPAS